VEKTRTNIIECVTLPDWSRAKANGARSTSEKRITTDVEPVFNAFLQPHNDITASMIQQLQHVVTINSNND